MPGSPCIVPTSFYFLEIHSTPTSKLTYKRFVSRPLCGSWRLQCRLINTVRWFVNNCAAQDGFSSFYECQTLCGEITSWTHTHVSAILHVIVRLTKHLTHAAFQYIKDLSWIEKLIRGSHGHRYGIGALNMFSKRSSLLCPFQYQIAFHPLSQNNFSIPFGKIAKARVASPGSYHPGIFAETRRVITHWAGMDISLTPLNEDRNNDMAPPNEGPVYRDIHTSYKLKMWAV